MIVDLDADEDLDKKDILNISWIIPFFGAVFAEYILTEGILRCTSCTIIKLSQFIWSVVTTMDWKDWSLGHMESSDLTGICVCA